MITPANHEVDGLLIDWAIEIKHEILHMNIKILCFFSSFYLSIFEKNGSPLKTMHVGNVTIHFVTSDINDKLVRCMVLDGGGGGLNPL